MKTITLMCFAIFIFGSTVSKAQNVFDKINATLNKVDKAANTADQAKGTGDKLFGFLSKKKKPGDPAAGNNTLITINGIDFSTLKTLNEHIQKCKGVESTKIKYAASGSTLQVQHAGSSEDLLKLIQKSDAKELFADKNLEGLEEGKIALNLVKKK
eukprot:gene11813-13774_t